MPNGPAAPAVTIAGFDGSDVSAVHAELVALYAVAYAAPPWSEGPDAVAGYRERLRAWAGRPGFAGLLARTVDGRLVGAVYGWEGAPEVGGEPLPGIPAARVFHVGDLMVHTDLQRQGLGRRLLDRFVADRRPAVLLTHPDGAAWRLYEAAGWRRTGVLSPSGAGDRLLVYLRT